MAREHGIDIDRFEIVDAPHSEAAAAKAVALIHESKGELLMKGSLHTDELMREVTSSKTGLRTARRIGSGGQCGRQAGHLEAGEPDPAPGRADRRGTDDRDAYPCVAVRAERRSGTRSKTGSMIRN